MTKRFGAIILTLCILAPLIGQNADEYIPEEDAQVHNTGRESRFVMRIDEPVSQLHPYYSIDVTESQIFTGLYEGLFSYDPYTGQASPALAETIEIEDEGQRWIFTIREKAFFQNGDPITAETFKNSWLALLDPQKEYAYASLLDVVKGAWEYRSGLFKSPDRVGLTVDEDDPKKLIVTLNRSTPYLPNILCHHAFAAIHPSMLQPTPEKTHPIIASGPFTLEERTDQHILLRKNAYYWDTERVGCNYIEILIDSDDAGVADAFNKGSIQWISGPIPFSLIADTRTAHVNPQFATNFLFFNVSSMVHKDLRVALLQAVPLDQLQAPFILPANTLIFPLTEYPSVKGLATSSVKKAQDMLSRINFDPASHAVIKIAIPRTELYAQLASILKDTWERLLFSVEIIPIDPQDYYDFLRTGEYDVGFLSWVGDFLDPMTFLELFRTDSRLNLAKWDNSAFDNLLEASFTENESNRLKKLAKAESLLLSEAVVLPLAFNPAVNIIDLRDIAGWYPNPLNIHPFKFLRFRAVKPLPSVAASIMPSVQTTID